MPHRKYQAPGLAVPSGRLSRLARFGGLASGIAGNMVLDGAKQFARGKRPSMSDLLLTPANALKVTHQLAQLRGAAMKIGQLMSMDAGELLPPELADILGRLRADAQHMPQGQLTAALGLRWGKGWQDRFAQFSLAPMAAASIGQVHRAQTVDGRDLAIKIQYPGVRHSIDSDVNNVAALMKMSGILPKTLDITPMLAEAKRQLHEEADYKREAHYLARFGTLLADAPEFQVPDLHRDLSTDTILAMTYLEGVPVESLVDAPQETRDRVMTLLVGLLFRELFEFHLMQTDPNFANYRYNPDTGQIVLLDFGATREFTPELVAAHRALMRAGLEGDGAMVRQAALDMGLLSPSTPADVVDTAMAMFELAIEPIRRGGAYDFANTDLTSRMRDEGMALATRRDVWHIPPIETLFLQRKFGGVYFLASRLKARVDVRAVLEQYL
ncbi:ABC1 kinase family protein [Rhodobacter ferrooxidans]|uniref:ABC-1 domain protein n=1 Tax=Rhodobacter ferrooxidans TaxID=371731 RepID=C8RYI8_9RHOB|nr:AarF/ABC1/UbiB kinase family protein [Rhodobacter sp. SW2]EEW26176.1 ABC-1 domain protein [Rhodobacter sp. SW2]